MTNMAGLILLLTAFAVGKAQQVCDGNAKLLSDLSARSTSNIPSEDDVPLTDKDLTEQWYSTKIDGSDQNQYVLADSVPDPSIINCGTYYLVYLQDPHPVLADGDKVDVDVCATDFLSVCSSTWTISIRRCSGKYEYLLHPTDDWHAYCFDPLNDNDPNLPPSDDVVDTPKVEVELKYSIQKQILGKIEIDLRIPSLEFYCNFEEDDYFYHVEWYVYDVMVLKTGPANTDIKESTKLPEKVLTDKGYSLGYDIQCGVSAANTELGLQSAMKFSRDFFAGIKVDTESPIYAKKGDTPIIKFRNTVPIGCLESATLSLETCGVSIRMHDPDDDNKCKATGVSALSQTKLCGDHLSAFMYEDWLDFQENRNPCERNDCSDKLYHNGSMTITTKNDAQYDGELTFTLRLSTGDTKHTIWKGYVIEDIMVIIQNDKSWERKSCNSHIDPHMKTFDGRYYENQINGTFYLYRHKTYPIEVQETTVRCHQTPFCTCSVLIRAGADIFLFSVCGGNKFIDFLKCGDGILDVRRITDEKYRIYTPIGTIIQITRRRWGYGTFLNVDIYASPKDFGKVEGICGNFDGNIQNDLVKPDGVPFPDPTCQRCRYHAEAFTKTWSVPDSKNLINEDNHIQATSWPVQYTFCVCPFIRYANGSVIEDLPDEEGDRNKALCSPSEFLTCDADANEGEKQTCNIRRGKRSAYSHSKELRQRFQMALNVDHSVWKRSTISDNVTLEENMQHCQGLFNGVSAFKDYGDKMPNSSATDTMLFDCGSDLDYVDEIDDSLLQAHTEGWKNTVLVEIKKDEEYAQENNETVEAFKESNCVNDCMGNGKCVAGVCNCTEGFVGDDCGINLSDPIDVEYIGGGQLCDREYEDCSLFRIQGDNIMKSVQCKIIETKMYMNGSTEVTTEVIPGERVNIFLTYCLAHDSSEQYSFVTKHEIFISNDGQNFGNSGTVYTYDSACQDYTNSSGELAFLLKENTCYIEGFCREPQESSSLDPCSICSPNDSTTAWTLISDNACRIDGMCVLDGELKQDAKCLKCSTATDETAWTLQSENCYIDAVCRESEEISATDPCLKCDPNTKTDGWTTILENACRIEGVCVANGEMLPDLDCQECSTAKNITAWTTVDGKCFIDGACWGSDEISDEDPCAVCSPSNNTAAWTIISDNACIIDGVCIKDGEKNGSLDCLMCSTATNNKGWTISESSCAIDGVCFPDGALKVGEECRACSAIIDPSNWTILDDKCYINGVCKDSQEVSYDDPCNVCTPNINQQQWTPKLENACSIGGACLADGEKNPNIDCQVCETATNRSAWSIANSTCFIDSVCIGEGVGNSEKNCLVCSPSNSKSIWTVAAEQCHIENVCRDPQDASGQDPCAICDPATNQEEWTPKWENACVIADTCFEDGATNPNKSCLICSSVKDTTGWTVKDGQCHIENVCRDPQDASSRDPCSICDPATNKEQWTPKWENACAIDGTCFEDGSANSDKNCLICSPVNNTATWTIRAEQCHIENVCRDPQDASGQDPCAICDPATNQEEWTPKWENACVIADTCFEDGATNPNKSCLICSSVKDTTGWTVKDGQCHIENVCRDPQDASSRDPCSICDPATNKEQWTPKWENACAIDGTCFEDGSANSDKNCLICSPVNNTATWTIRAEQCHIENVCRDPQDASGQDPCAICDPATNQEEWTPKWENACVIADTCFEDGATNPNKSCLICSSVKDTTGWTVKDGQCHIENVCRDPQDASSRDPCSICDPATNKEQWTPKWENACAIDGTCFEDGSANSDKNCLICSPVNNTATWTIRAEQCHIENVCRDPQDASGQDPCAICDPATNQEEWTPKWENACVIADTCFEDGATNPNKSCLICSSVKDTTGWTVKDGQCHIENVCRDPQDASSRDPCSICDPATNKEQWTPKWENACAIDGTCFEDGSANSDKNCLICSPVNNTATWTIRAEQCHIENVCRDPQDASGQDPCAICDPATNQEEWTPKWENACVIADTCFEDGATNPNKSCLICSSVKDTTGWTVKDGQCHIENVCRDPQDASSRDPCSICDPATNKEQWTPKWENACAIDGTCFEDGSANSDKNCLICSPVNNTATWTIRAEQCHIENVCRDPQDASGQDPCAICDPATNQEEWTPKWENACVIADTCFEDGATNPNKSCLICSSVKDTTGWTVKDGQCHIENVCRDPQDASSRDPCSICDPATNKEQWTPKWENACAIDGTCFEDGSANSDKNCLICSPVNNTATWTIRAEQCHIENVCRDPQDASGQDPCSICDPATNQEEWTPKWENACVIAGTCFEDGATNPNKSCLICSSVKDTTGWTVKDGQCHIENVCRDPQDASSQDPCSICDPATNQEEWTTKWESACVIDGACVETGNRDIDKNCLICSPSDKISDWTLMDGFCFIDDQCQSDGTTSSTDSCNVCSVADSRTEWSNGCTTSTLPSTTPYPDVGQVEVRTALEYESSESGQVPRLAFRCHFQTAEQFFYAVTWYIDGSKIIERDPVPADRLNEAVLGETDVTSRGYGLQILVKCGVSVMADANGPKSPMAISDEFFAGLKVLTPTLTLPSNGQVDIILQQTVPLGCSQTDAENGRCRINIIAWDPSDNDDCAHTSIAVKDGSTCGVVIPGVPLTELDDCNECWLQTKAFTVTAINQDYYNGKTGFNLKLVTADTGAHVIWKSNTVSDVQVHVSEYHPEDKDHCYSVVDPHLHTKDGINYDNHNDGEFVLYKHKKYPIEVHEKTALCNESSIAYCTCAVTVGAGGDIFTLDFCGVRKYIGYHSCKDDILDVRKVEDIHYQIFTPTGSYVDVFIVEPDGGKRFLNVHVYMSPKDFNATEGLCGNFNGNSNDDFTSRDGSVVDISENPDDFILSWKVPESESLRNDINHDPDLWPKSERLCTCGSQTGVSVCSLSESQACSVHKAREGIKQTKLCSKRNRRSLQQHSAEIRRRASDEVVSPWNNHRIVKRDVMAYEDAYAQCSTVLRSTAVWQYETRMPEGWFNASLRNCAIDLQLTGDTTWINTHEDDIKNVIKNENNRDPVYVQQNTEEVQQFMNIACPRNCNRKGSCVNGKCSCNSGYYGDTCSIDETVPLHVEDIEGGGICDTKDGYVCPTCYVIQTENLLDGFKCRFIESQVNINGVITESSRVITTGVRLSLFQGECCLSETDSIRKRRDVKAVFMTIFAVSVSNDGVNFGDEAQIYVHDSTCQVYVPDVSRGVSIDVKDGTCFIEAQCRQERAASAEDACLKCVPSSDKFSWTNTCYEKTEGTISISGMIIITVSVGCGILIAMVILIGVLCYVRGWRKRRNDSDRRHDYEHKNSSRRRSRRSRRDSFDAQFVSRSPSSRSMYDVDYRGPPAMYYDNYLKTGFNEYKSPSSRSSYHC